MATDKLLSRGWVPEGLQICCFAEVCLKGPQGFMRGSWRDQGSSKIREGFLGSRVLGEGGVE
eukprot:2436030-Alexandrium_andersonii.AAC.1